MKKFIRFTMLFLVSATSFSVSAQKLTDLAQQSYVRLKEQYTSLDYNKPEAMRYVNALILKAKIENNSKQLFSGYRTAADFSTSSQKLAYADSMVWAAEKTNDKDILGSAWLSKGVNFYNLRNYTSALDAYNKAEEYLKNSKDEYLKFKTLYNLALVNAYLGYSDIAITKFEACKSHFYHAIETSTHPNEVYNNRKYYLFTLHRLVNLYQSSGQFAKSKTLLALGLKESANEEFWYENALLKKSSGIQQFYEQEYNKSIQTLESLIPVFKKEDNFDWLAVCYFYTGKDLEALKNMEQARNYFIKTDSVFRERKYINPELRETYEILLAHYRNENDKENRLYYIERLLEVNKVMEKDFAYLNSILHKKKEFETASLLLEKKQIMEGKRAQSVLFLIFMVLGSALLVFVLYKLYWVYRQNKQLKLLLERPAISSVTMELNDKNTMQANKLPDEKVSELLEKLNVFEQKNGFKEQGLALETLAKKFDTNSHYLSEVINNHLGKNFNSYLNELRINHLIDELKFNPPKRKRKLEMLAKELGYANRQSFTRAFQSVTQMPPSYFIRKLEREFDAVMV